MIDEGVDVRGCPMAGGAAAGASIRTLLVGPRGHGGEDVYFSSLCSHPPDGISYELAGDFHRGAPHAPCDVVREILLNRVVYPFTIPDIGFRALRLSRAFDLVHVHAHPNRLRNLGRVPLVLSEGSSPVVYLKHYLGWDEGRLTRGLSRSRRIYRLLGINDRLLALERASCAYVFSEWARSLQIRWGADPAKVEVVYPGFATPELPAREARSHFRFLFVGRDFERKGGFELIEAFALVVEHFADARLMLAGSDPAERNPDRMIHSWVPVSEQKRILELLAQLERRGVVERLPWVDRRRLLQEVYPNADAFVMPTHAEGFGFTNVEAMSFALPVVTSNEGPGSEIVHDGETGIIVRPGDPEQLASAMISLMSDRDATRRMGESGRTDFLKRFTLQRFRANLGDLYRRALAS
jgi:glycosyltransferase involved in cell wall biosynthesis